MTVLNIRRRASTHVSRDAPTKIYANNPKHLVTRMVAGLTRVRSMMIWTIPPIVLEADTQIANAYVTVHPVGAYSGIEFRLGRVLSKWTPGKYVKWDNRPDIDQANAVTVTTTVAQRYYPLEFDVTEHLRTMQSGAVNWGWALWTLSPNDTGRKIANYGAHRPMLTIEYYRTPQKPTDLTPASGHAVSTPTPVLSARDVDAEATLVTGIEVELYDNETLVWSSGMLPADSATLDLSQHGDVPEHVAGEDRGWRMRVRGMGNLVGPWSDLAIYPYVPLGSTTILAPAEAPDNVVTDPSPPFLWENTFTQSDYRLMITDPSLPPQDRILWDSGIVTSEEATATPTQPVATEPGALRRAVLWTFDDVERASGSTNHVETTRDFTLGLSASVPPAEDFQIIDLAPLPFVKGTWTRANIPDEWHWVRDGVVVAIFAGPDLLVEGSVTEYEFIDHEAAPRREHTWLVRAVENGAASSVNAPITTTIEPGGIWLCDPEDGIYLPFITDAEQEFTLSETGGTHFPLHARVGVRITSTQRGYEGAVNAELLATTLSGPMTGADLRDAFLEVRTNAGRRLILTVGDYCWPVVAYNMTVAPTKHVGRNGDYLYTAEFQFLEVD